MFTGIGTDIIEVERIKKVIDRFGQKFLDKIFTKTEQKYCLRFKDSHRHFAGRFAAKEALAKALGTGLAKEYGWTDLEIINNKRGKPEVHLSPQHTALEIHVSISHCKEYATATAIILKKE